MAKSVDSKKQKPQRLVHARISVKMILESITDKPNTSLHSRKRKWSRLCRDLLRRLQYCTLFVLIGLVPVSGDTESQAPPCGKRTCYIYTGTVHADALAPSGRLL